MTRIFLTLSRLCSAMWVGAALLFVLTSVTEQVQESFAAETKDTLALIRFPWYYGTGFCLVGVSFVASALASRGRATGHFAAALLATALLLMAADYLIVYRPMRDLLLEHLPTRTARFESLHLWSEIINSISFSLSLAAAVSLCASRDNGATRGATNHEAETAASTH